MKKIIIGAGLIMLAAGAVVMAQTTNGKTETCSRDAAGICCPVTPDCSPEDCCDCGICKQ